MISRVGGICRKWWLLRGVAGLLFAIVGVSVLLIGCSRIYKVWVSGSVYGGLVRVEIPSAGKRDVSLEIEGGRYVVRSSVTIGLGSGMIFVCEDSARVAVSRGLRPEGGSFLFFSSEDRFIPVKWYSDSGIIVRGLDVDCHRHCVLCAP